MKRKLFCIFLMLVGAAIIAGTILLSQGRSEHHDPSPVYTLIILSVIMIVAAAFHINAPYKPEVSGRERVFLRAFRAVNILSILVCFAFVVIMLFLTDYHDDIDLPNVFLLMIPAAAGIIVAALSLKVRPPIIVRDIAKAAVSIAIAAALCFVYLNYLPKYSQNNGILMISSDEEFAQKDVFYPQSIWYGNGIIPRHSDSRYAELFGDNPFYNELFIYHCDSYGYDAGGLHDVKGYILFNPATGTYKYTRVQEQDKTYGPGEWPEFNWNFMYDRDGQHGAVLNLYFRGWFPIPEEDANEHNPIYSASSNDWDAKLKDVMYPHNFPENEARAFLRSIGEETLKAELFEQVNGDILYTMSKVKDKTVEVFFFGIDTATYQNGEIILKL